MKIIIDEIAMDLNAVKLLARVAETRSFTQAAVSLGLTQSGLIVTAIMSASRSPAPCEACRERFCKAT